MSLHTREYVASVIRSIVMIFVALVCLIPLYMIVVNTFKDSAGMSQNPFGLPSRISFDNYVYAFENLPIVRSTINTVIVTGVAVFLQVLIGSLGAYGIIQKNSRFTAAIGTFLMLSFIIPGQALLIPQYQMESAAGLTDSLLGLIVIYLASATFCYFLIVGYMRGLPKELFEAARLDGASPFRIYWQIVLPLCRPILATVVVFETMWTWNDFVTPKIYISSNENQTLVLQVYNAIGQFTTNWPLFMTITVLALVPVFFFFVLCQKWIVSGLVSGSVKG
ncbi:carbohydrate ABC transporter permease [Bifidobacterium aerophilum]|uniref:ABC transporter permease subunit n=1 Tax=Bifidobacterium aerophilum TaxID=1798155 RepID=A0A6N9Z2S9_9BIFI|nr:carbohydrate ABC transporter permease [Bifidobacterium aerophilum]NEG88949.1 ABC transporter permease subunit [Bifidobacterium aerophilum]